MKYPGEKNKNVPFRDQQAESEAAHSSLHLTVDVKILGEFCILSHINKKFIFISIEIPSHPDSPQAPWVPMVPHIHRTSLRSQLEEHSASHSPGLASPSVGEGHLGEPPLSISGRTLTPVLWGHRDRSPQTPPPMSVAVALGGGGGTVAFSRTFLLEKTTEWLPARLLTTPYGETKSFSNSHEVVFPREFEA